VPKYRVTRAAERDLLAIGRYTEAEWGAGQRRAYLAQLDDRMRTLAQNPKTGRARDEIRVGYRSYHEGRHILFYREIDDIVEFVRILHDSMDISGRLEEL